MIPRTEQATGEALLTPERKTREQGTPYNCQSGSGWKGERVADGCVVAEKRGNARGAKAPCCEESSNAKGGQDEMRKTSIGWQDQRRKIYIKAKAETSSRWLGCEKWSIPSGRGESVCSLIGAISFDTNRTGKRSAGKPHAAFEEAGDGNGVGDNHRAIPRPYVRPGKAVLFSRSQSCQGKSPSPVARVAV